MAKENCSYVSKHTHTYVYVCKKDLKYNKALSLHLCANYSTVFGEWVCHNVNSTCIVLYIKALLWIDPVINIVQG